MKSYHRIHLILVNAFLWMIIGLYIPFLSSFLTLKDLNPNQIGILIAVYPLLSILVVPLWGKISDQAKSKNLVLQIVCTGIALSVLLFYLADSFMLFLMCSCIFCFFLVALTPLLDTLLTTICREQSFQFSSLRIGGTVGYAGIVFIYGFI